MSGQWKKILLSSALVVLMTACTRGAFCPQSMDGWGGMMGPGFWGGGIMWIIWLILIVVIIYFVVGFGNKSGSFPGARRESALDILKKRYARGEISKAEYEELKRDIAD